ncbi:hypothetical protein ACH4UY_19595 [Streptomyces longwoodensis]
MENDRSAGRPARRRIRNVLAFAGRLAVAAVAGVARSVCDWMLDGSDS